MTYDRLFQTLDLDGDGALSRADLRDAAASLDWGWHEAQVFAVLDLYSVVKPLSRDGFTACMESMADDPMGPYGKVLLGSPAASPRPLRKASLRKSEKRDPPGDMVSLLANVAGREAADDYLQMLKALEAGTEKTAMGRAALIIIDPQQSFTQGAWMQSIGPGGKRDVEPIVHAFASCAFQLQNRIANAEVLFSRCPFPPASYPWDEALSSLIPEDQVYFIKPGNSLLWPPTNGVSMWIRTLIEKGVDTLVLGGCTLNSCVRVSAIEAQDTFSDEGLQVVVDLSLCGGRAGNYVRSPEFGGISSVALAIEEMQGRGVTVVPQRVWQ